MTLTRPSATLAQVQEAVAARKAAESATAAEQRRADSLSSRIDEARVRAALCYRAMLRHEEAGRLRAWTA